MYNYQSKKITEQDLQGKISVSDSQRRPNSTGCLTGGAWPPNALSVICDGSTTVLAADSFAGEYTLLNVTSGVSYTFETSVPDFITISDEAGTEVHATGTGSVTWTATSTGVVRFYNHLDENCSTESEFRTKQVTCGAPATDLPECPTPIAPSNGATNIDYTSNLKLEWTLPTSGGLPSGINVYLDKVDGSTILGTIAGNDTWATISGLEENTTYYWKVSSVNAAGESAGCQVFSFSTGSNPFPPYCGPLSFQYLTELITRVLFAGIDNSSPAEGSEVAAHENFIDITGNVSRGETYLMTLEGNTEGGPKNYFAVFIDWNQNGNFNDAGESYFTDGSVSVFSSTGLDGIQAFGDITVPAEALPGTTRMRVKKDYGNYEVPANFDDPCFGGLYGQIEDYSLNVGVLGISEADGLNNVSLYPNPATVEVNVKGMNVQKAEVFSADGKLVMISGDSSTVKTNQLAPGVYLIKLTDKTGNTTTKRFIKK